MKKEKIDWKPVILLFNIIFAVAAIFFAVGFFQASEKLNELQRLDNAVLKGSYYTGMAYGADYTMAFSDDRFILQDQNKTVDLGTYEEAQEWVYNWQGEHDGGFVVLQNGGIAVYFQKADKVLTLQKHDDIPVTFGGEGNRAEWLDPTAASSEAA